MTPEGSLITMFLFSSNELSDEHEWAGKEELTIISLSELKLKASYLPLLSTVNNSFKLKHSVNFCKTASLEKSKNEEHHWSLAARLSY